MKSWKWSRSWGIISLIETSEKVRAKGGINHVLVWSRSPWVPWYRAQSRTRKHLARTVASNVISYLRFSQRINQDVNLHFNKKSWQPRITWVEAQYNQASLVHHLSLWIAKSKN
jgi:hypothetical protein